MAEQVGMLRGGDREGVLVWEMRGAASPVPPMRCSLLLTLLLDADSDSDAEDKAVVSAASREDIYAAFHKGTNSSKKKKQVGGGGS
jgi:hypothetical protein